MQAHLQVMAGTHQHSLEMVTDMGMGMLDIPTDTARISRSVTTLIMAGMVVIIILTGVARPLILLRVVHGVMGLV